MKGVGFWMQFTISVHREFAPFSICVQDGLRGRFYMIRLGMAVDFFLPPQSSEDTQNIVCFTVWPQEADDISKTIEMLKAFMLDRGGESVKVISGSGDPPQMDGEMEGAITYTRLQHESLIREFVGFLVRRISALETEVTKAKDACGMATGMLKKAEEALKGVEKP